MRNKQNRELAAHYEIVGRWRQAFANTKAQQHLTTRQTVRKMAKNHLSLNLNTLLPNGGRGVQKKVLVLLHPNRGKNANTKALRQVLTAELSSI